MLREVRGHDGGISMCLKAAGWVAAMLKVRGRALRFCATRGLRGSVNVFFLTSSSASRDRDRGEAGSNSSLAPSPPPSALCLLHDQP